MLVSVVDIVVSVILGVSASSGFWAYITRKDNVKTATLQLLLGLAHDRIIYLGMTYIERGWITKDEYEDFVKYLYKPYSQFGGNGLAEKVMQDINHLPIYNKTRPEIEKIERLEEEHGTGE